LYQKQVAMLHQRFTSNKSVAKIQLLLSTAEKNSLVNRNDSKQKNCTYRDANGWCNKSQQQCAALNILFSKH
jgi:hypothetical protein